MDYAVDKILTHFGSGNNIQFIVCWYEYQTSDSAIEASHHTSYLFIVW